MIPLVALWANPWVRRVALYAAIAAAAWYGLRLYSNRVYSQGMVAGRQAAAVELERAKQGEWAAEREKLAGEAQILVVARNKLASETADLARERAAINRTLQQVIAASTAGKGVIDAQVSAVAVSDLDAVLRTVSAELGRPAK